MLHMRFIFSKKSLSILVFTTGVVIYFQFEALIQPESLKNLLLGSTGPASASLLGNKDTSHEAKGNNDLDSAESKTNDQNNSKNDSSSEEEEDNNNSGEEAVTMLKLPVELSFQEVSCPFLLILVLHHSSYT